MSERNEDTAGDTPRGVLGEHFDYDWRRTDDFLLWLEVRGFKVVPRDDR